MTLWSGRVEGGLDPAVWAFLRADDAELLPYDCEATSSTPRLYEAGLLSDDELAEVEGRSPDRPDPDASSTRTRTSTRRSSGCSARSGGRSTPAGRATTRSPPRSGSTSLDACVEARWDRSVRRVVLDRAAEAEADTAMPGYTHLQRGAAGDARPPPARVGRDARPRPRRFACAAQARRGRWARVRSRARRSPAAAVARCGTRSTRSPTATSRSTTSTRSPCSSRTSRGSAKSSCCGRLREFGFVPAARARPDGLVDDAAEAEPRRRRACPRQGRHRDRAADRPARDGQGPAARVQPRPAGGQAAGFAARRDVRRAGAHRPRRRSAVRPGAARRGRIRPPACSPPTPPRRSSPRACRSATRTSGSPRPCATGPSWGLPESVGSASPAPGPGGVREALAEARQRFGESL